MARDTPYAHSEEPISKDVALAELPGKLRGLSLPRQVFVLAIWPFLEQLMNFLVGMVDLAIAGRLEPETLRVPAVDALAVAGYLMWLLGLLSGATGVGATALVSRAVGGGHKGLANAATAQSFLLALLFGAISGAALFIGADAIAGAFNLSPESHPLATIYLRIIAVVAPVHAVLFVGSAALRGAGDTRSAFIAMVCVNLVNIAVSVLLVFGPEPIGGWGVAGIAIGTAVGWLVGAVIIIIALIAGWGGVRLRRRRLRPHWHTIRRILRVGIPSGFESGGMWLINAAVLFFVSTFPIDGALGAHMIAIRIEAISFLPGFAIGIAAATLTGQYLGLGDPHRAKRAAMLCCLIGMGTMSVMGLTFMIVPEWWVMLVSAEATHLDYSPILLMICGPVQPLFAAYLILGNALRGAGETRTTMRMSFASLLVVRLAGAMVIGVILDYQLIGVWFALCADLAVKGILFSARFLHGGWTKTQV